MSNQKYNFSSNVELEMVTAYQSGEQIKDIMSRYEINDRHALYRILDKWKVDRKVPGRGKGHRKSKEKTVECRCGHKNPQGSKFCNMCGKSLKTEQELILDGLLNARAKCLQYVPAGIRADVDRQTMDAVELIRKTFGIEG